MSRNPLPTSYLTVRLLVTGQLLAEARINARRGFQEPRRGVIARPVLGVISLHAARQPWWFCQRLPRHAPGTTCDRLDRATPSRGCRAEARTSWTFRGDPRNRH